MSKGNFTFNEHEKPFCIRFFFFTNQFFTPFSIPGLKNTILRNAKTMPEYYNTFDNTNNRATSHACKMFGFLFFQFMCK
jgi:hypothetical protein